MYSKTMAILTVCSLTNAVFGTHSSLPFIRADLVHNQGITGRGVTVAVIDTGIFYDHTGLGGSIGGGGVSYVFNNQTVNDGGADVNPDWSDGHGTHVSLIVTDAWGVAPAASILPIRVFEVYDTPEGPVFGALPNDVIRAIDYARRRRAADPSIRVINLSLGSIDLYPCTCDD